MRSIHDIVDLINTQLVLPEHSKTHGIGQTVLRGDDKLPAIVKQNGEAEYVGIDDRFSVRVYHKLNSVNIRRTAGYGTSIPIVNSYSLSMIIFSNRKLSKLFSDELLTLIQSQVPDSLGLKPYAQIVIALNSANLNDLQVYNQEYATKDYRLGPQNNLFQLNYTVEASFTKGCFNTC